MWLQIIRLEYTTTFDKSNVEQSYLNVLSIAIFLSRVKLASDNRDVQIRPQLTSLLIDEAVWCADDERWIQDAASAHTHWTVREDIQEYLIRKLLYYIKIRLIL